MTISFSTRSLLRGISYCYRLLNYILLHKYRVQQSHDCFYIVNCAKEYNVGSHMSNIKRIYFI
jgi:hypothetical protein